MRTTPEPAVTKPKLLFLSHRFPYPPDKGDKIRALNILEHLARRYEVFLGCLDGDDDGLADPDWAERKGYRVYRGVTGRAQRLAQTAGSMINGSPLSLGYFRCAGLEKWASGVLTEHKPELIYVYSSAMAQYVLGRVRYPSILLMDFVDVDSLKWKQYASSKHWSISWLYELEARRLLEHDRKVAAATDASLFVSDAERNIFADLAPSLAQRLFTVPNGVDTELFSPTAGLDLTEPNPESPRIVFVGVMDYWPNVEAAQWFANEVLPKIRRSVPTARFQIVGSRPAPSVTALAGQPGIDVTGSVADVRPYLKNARVVVTPLRIARGIQNKVLEGMAMGKPLVSTPGALEGIDASAGEHLLVAEDAETFAAHVLACLTGDPAASAMGRKAREFVVNRYSWTSQLSVLDQIIDRITKQRADSES
jgi:sugar transferase (PEP-CTERM/EpsH1 system associated)